MKRIILCICVIIMVRGGCTAQDTHKIRYRADMGFYDEEYMPGAQRLIGNVVFSHDSIHGYCDSAYFYEQDNYIIAFGDRVRIYVGDSVRLYGYRAYYDGNAGIASIADRVTLIRDSSSLFTDSLIYDLNVSCGYYLTGGMIVNDADTLTSLRGHYYTDRDEAFAHDNVLLRSISYRMNCNALQYNMAEKMAYFISKTHLVSKDNEIYTDGGRYDTQHDIATLCGNVQLFNEAQTMYADSVYYDRNLRFGRGRNHVTIVDTVQNYVLCGNYVEHYETEGFSIATDSNLLILIDDKHDSLFLHCDTLKILFDTHRKLQRMMAYNRTKFYRNDLQGACDSLVYIAEDSTITMYFNPVIWSAAYQLTGDTIRFSLLDSVNMQVDLCTAGFIAGGLYGATDFNQIKGIDITGFIRDRQLRRVDIVNNAECIYYIQEEDSSLIGINTSLTNEMRIFLNDNKITQIRYYDAPDGKVYPDEQFADEDRKLRDFRWLDEYRPRCIPDLYCHYVPRVKRAADEDDTVP